MVLAIVIEKVRFHSFPHTLMSVGMRNCAKFRSHNTITASSIREFTQEIGIPQGIVVGRLQHDKVIALVI